MNILITGISGFIGQHLVDFFYAKGDRVFGTSRNPAIAKEQFSTKVDEIVQHVEASYLNDHQIEVIIHLAGLAHDTKNSTYSDQDYFDVNYEQTRILYDHFLTSKSGCFIYLSSIKAAVDFTHEVVDENVVANPVTAYGKSKLKAEEYLMSRLSKKKKCFILRPCVVYGPGNKGNLNLLHQFVQRGLPYPLGAFKNKRSFLFIHNLSFAIHEMVNKSAASGVYHVADDQSISTQQLIELMGISIHRKARIWAIPKFPIRLLARAGDVMKLFFNTHTLNKMTENMEVSNQKLVNAIGTGLPYSTEMGLQETFKTFKK